jgi:murein DD-endopeptidase MepM/ murein hydrolase activator NlpD
MHKGKSLLAAALAGSLVLGLQVPAHAKTAESRPQLAVVDMAKTGQGYNLAPTELTAKNLAAATVTVTVASGDTLSGLASRLCGNWSGWNAIYNENRDVVGGDPNLIFPGQQLVINCASGTAATAPSPAPTAPAPVAAPASGWTNPLPGVCITSGFGPRWGSFHWGVDLGGGTGTPIHAATSGTVVSSGWIYSGYGIDTLIQNDAGYWTHYAHQSRTVVSSGQHVNVGDVIGYVGSTGQVTGPHLHFEIWSRGSWGSGNPQIDPVVFMADRGVTLGC